MNLQRILIGTLALGLLLALAVGLSQAQEPEPQDIPSSLAEVGTGFTYQGQLKSAGEPVSGDCEMAFRLYDAAAPGGSQVGSPITRTVTISDGLFTEQLDFGAGVFDGDARWLDIRVQCPGDGDYTDLGRQALTAAPYASYALGAPWGGLSDMPGGFADGVDDVSAVVSGTNFIAGAGLSQEASGNVVMMSVDFTGSGSADTVARSDHDHDGTYSPLGHTHDDRYYTEAELSTGGGGGQVHWDNLTSVPAGLDDGDDDTLTGLSCTDDQVTKWDSTTGQWVCASDETGVGGDYWSLNGNAGTDPDSNFLGTTDEVSLTLAVSGTAVLRLEPNATSPNLIGGYSGNSVGPLAYGATIGGGGASGYTNSVTAEYATVGGGAGNIASGPNATVGGGYNNTASEWNATVSGGKDNTASTWDATVSGGVENTASGLDSTVGGGWSNTASGDSATVGGGSVITASGDYATVGGGSVITASGNYATVGGGRDNTASGYYATVGGGWDNTASGYRATVGGGNYNTASDYYATVGGGGDNTASGYYATVGGGGDNTASGYHATVGGGNYNNASNSYATVGGGYNSDATGSSATVGGGAGNAASNSHATVGGGLGNTASGFRATVGGGMENTASGSHATVGGGRLNDAVYTYTTVSGGERNEASGSHATVPGGDHNIASGDYSFAAGRQALAEHDGTFVWADSNSIDFASTGVDQFLIEADGGVGVGTNDPASPLHVQAPVPSGASLSGHVTAIENTNTGANPDVLALKVNIANPTVGTNFITFRDSSGSVGAIEGDGSGGVTYESGSGDFAEYLPRLEPAETLVEGDIVGLFAGGVSRETAGARRALVVSTAPIVLGNRPPTGEEERHVPIALLGQVPVRVRGEVQAGDYILPSGREDGTGIAVPPQEITVEQAAQVVGRALEGADETGVSQVKTLVGLPQEQILQTVLERRDARITDLEARVAALERAVDAAQPSQSRVPTLPLLLGGLVVSVAVLGQRRYRGGQR